MRRKVMMAFSFDSEWGFCFLCLPIAWKIEDKLRDIKFQAEGGKRDVGVYCKQLLPSALHVVVHKKKPHHIHRWLHNPRQMSEGLAWQLEHLWKRTAQRARWIYRWLYVRGDDGKPITNVSIILFSGTLNQTIWSSRRWCSPIWSGCLCLL